MYKYHSLLKWEASSLGKKVYLRQTVIERNREAAAAFSINRLRDRQISACKLANWWKKNLPSHQFHETWLLSNTYEVCLHLKYLTWNRKCTSKDSLNLFLIWFRLKNRTVQSFPGLFQRGTTRSMQAVNFDVDKSITHDLCLPSSIDWFFVW